MITHARPCPWCGAGKSNFDFEIASRPFGTTALTEKSIRCVSCGNGGSWADDESAALAAWNTRPIEDAMLALLIEHSGDPDAPCSCDDWMATPTGTKCLNCRTKAMIQATKGGSA